MPIVISEKDRKFIERLGRHRILSENEINELMERCEREVRKKFNKDPYILIKNPGFLIKTYNEIFQSEKSFSQILKLYGIHMTIHQAMIR